MITQWPNLCTAMGQPKLAEDERFKDMRGRIKNRFERVDIIEAWLAFMPGNEESIRVHEKHHVPIAPMLRVAEAIDHPHLQERQTVRKVSDQIFDEVEIPGVPLHFSQFPELLDLEAPFLGEHNAHILSELLGYSRDNIAALVAKGVLLSRDKS